MRNRSGLALALLLAAACGGEGDQKSAAPAGGMGPSASAPEVKPETPPAAKPAEPGGNDLSGSAVVTGASGAGADAPLRLVLGDAGRLAGSLAVDGAKCEIAGLVDDAVARGWIECPAAASGVAPRRGVLIGEGTGGSYSGTFAISDDGAATVLNGTWKAGKQTL